MDPSSKSSAAHREHTNRNRHILSSAGLQQRRANIGAAIDICTLLFLGTDSQQPRIPLREQNQSISVGVSGQRGGTVRVRTTEQVVYELIADVKEMLAPITDEQAGDEIWLRDNNAAAYTQYRACENRFLGQSAYPKILAANSAKIRAVFEEIPEGATPPKLTQIVYKKLHGRDLKGQRKQRTSIPRFDKPGPRRKPGNDLEGTEGGGEASGSNQVLHNLGRGGDLTHRGEDLPSRRLGRAEQAYGVNVYEPMARSMGM